MIRQLWLYPATLAVVALGIAACGGSGGSGGSGAAAGGGQTVSLRSAGGMADVLTSAAGRTLYVSDEEGGGTVLCAKSDCTSIWMPLTVSSGQQPTAPAAVRSSLGTVKRSDGSTQVTFGGKPLYTFSLDHGPGQVNGNDAKDSFDGTNFVWHAATSSGAAPVASPSASSGGYSYGGGYGLH